MVHLRPASICGLAILMLLGTASTWAEAPPTNTARPASDDAIGEVEEGSPHRQREGTHLTSQHGYFRGSGDGLIFHLRGSKEKYPALENLALERVGKVMSDRHDHPDQLTWEVRGFFTEYRGSNYMVITHAVILKKNRRRSRP